MSMTVKKGDNVVVIAGKEKGKTGKVLEVFPEDNRVLVDGVNIVSKHQKARRQDEKSAIIKRPAPIEASNVMVVCSTCGKATRVAHKEIEGKKVRVCKKCSASLDKEYVKATKKDAKKNIASAKAEEKKTESVKPEANKKSASKTTKTSGTKSASAKPASKTASKPATKSTTTQKSTKKATNA